MIIGRVFAASDFHGNWTASKKLIDFLQPDDILYYLGDCTDRGKYGIKLFQLLMNDKRVRMIMGNHDQFLEEAIKQVNYEENEIEGKPESFPNPHFDLIWWIGTNGGRDTYDDSWKLTKVERLKILHFIEHMPTEYIYYSFKGHNIILEHAGYSPFDIPHRTHEPLWDRGHFEDPWSKRKKFKEMDAETTYLVHGHTPVQYLKFYYGFNGQEPLTKEEMRFKKEFNNGLSTKYKPTILRYCEGHKFDIDLCTICSNRVALLDLDTFEEYYFDGKDEE